LAKTGRANATKKPARAVHTRSYQAQRRKRRSRALLAQSLLSVMIVVLLFGISYVSVKIIHGERAWPVQLAAPSASHAPQEGTPRTPDAAVSAPADTTPAPDALPAIDAGPQSWNTAAPVAQAQEEGPLAEESRLLAVPANGRLTNEYFRTALFIGDSLSQGFAIYEPTREVAAVCAYKSTSPNQVLQNYVGTRPDGTKIEMWDEINIQTPGNIYLLFGTNALLQQSDEAFLKYYGDLMDKLRERFPDVPIYVQSITPTTVEQGVKQPPLENGHIRTVNNAVAKMAREKGLYYLDAQEALADAEGNLRADYVGNYDGIHMNPTGYAAWADYILTHTVYSVGNAAYVAEGPYA